MALIPCYLGQLAWWYFLFHFYRLMDIAEALFLNLWPLGNLNEILIKQVPANIMNWWLMYLLWNYPQVDFTDAKSTLVQVVAWYCQATSHCLSQCWPITLSLYDVTRPQWVHIMDIMILQQHLFEFEYVFTNHMMADETWFELVVCRGYMVYVAVFQW